MSFHDFFNSFFGERYGGNGRPPENEDGDFFNLPSDNFRNPHGDGMRDTPVFDFKMMSDPFAMHTYFEKRINDVMKSFMFSEMFSSIEGPGIFDAPSEPTPEEKQHPRDFYLKTGIPKFKNEEDGGKEPSPSMKRGWLDSFLPPGTERPSPSQPHTYSSFRSVVRRTVTLPDGTMKTEEIIRNSDGTEEKTESHILPDGSSPSSSDIHFGTLHFSDWFGDQNWPGIKKNVPRDHFLKPGYEKLNGDSEKIDTDLDKQILQSGVKSLPAFSKESAMIDPNHNFTFKSFTKRTVTLPNGAIESEEVVRNADGTEERTVTRTGTATDGLSSLDSEPTNRDSYKSDAQSPLTLTLKGVKDLLDLLFK